MNLQKVVCVLLLLGYGLYGYSQDITLQVGGVNVSKYNNNFQSPYNLYDTQENTTIDRKIYAVNGILDFKRDTTKLYRLKVGYNQTRWNSQSNRQSTNGNHSINSTETFQKSAYFQLALGRELPLRIKSSRFLVKYGLGLPFNYMYQDKETRWTDLLNNGTDTVLIEKVSEYPSTYTFGLDFFSSFQYNVIQKLWFGFELENGLHYIYQAGKTEVTYNDYEPVTKNISSTEIQTEDLKDSGFVTSLLNLSLNLTYRF